MKKSSQMQQSIDSVWTVDPISVKDIVSLYLLHRVEHASAVSSGVSEDIAAAEGHLASFEAGLYGLGVDESHTLRLTLTYFDAWSADMRRMVDELQQALELRSPRPSTVNVRSWARAHGYDVAAKGKLPHHIHQAYDRARRAEQAAERPSPGPLAN